MCYAQGWFSPGQVFVLDEYCARYGVRGCHRHLCYLSDLLERAENGAMIDPTLLHYSFAFCASHVHGNRYSLKYCFFCLVLQCTRFLFLRLKIRHIICDKWMTNKTSQPMQTKRYIIPCPQFLCFLEFYTFFVFSCMSASYNCGCFFAWSIFLCFLFFPFCIIPFLFYSDIITFLRCFQIPWLSHLVSLHISC